MNKLYLTYCSGKKHSIDSGTPKELYDSDRVRRFINRCEYINVSYAILSGKYGIVTKDRNINNYDTIMPTEKDNTNEYTTMKIRIGQQLNILVPSTIIFYVPNEYRAKRYINIIKSICESRHIKLNIVNRLSDIHDFQRFNL